LANVNVRTGFVVSVSLIKGQGMHDPNKSIGSSYLGVPVSVVDLEEGPPSRRCHHVVGSYGSANLYHYARHKGEPRYPPPTAVHAIQTMKWDITNAYIT
jgi:hypothetical protein